MNQLFQRVLFFHLYHQDAVNTLNIVRNAVSPQFGYKYHWHTVKTMNMEGHHIFFNQSHYLLRYLPYIDK